MRALGIWSWGLLLYVAPAVAAEPTTVPVLSVQGEATLQVPADWVSLSLVVESSDKTADAALEQNTRLVARVRRALTKAGVTDGELSTGSFSVQPMWEPAPRQAAGEWRPQILGFRVRNRLTIGSSQLAKVGEWIQAAVEAGATGAEGIRFSLADAAAAKDRATAEAIARARRSAEVAAQAAGVRLATLVDVRVDGAMPRPMVAAVRMEAARMVQAAPPEITPGEVEVQSHVDLTYRMGD